MKLFQKVITVVVIIALVMALIIIWIFADRISELQNELTKYANQKPEKTLSQSSEITSSIDRSDVIYSPDRSMKVYLEKEFNPGIQRFVRQSVILENVLTKNKQVLNEIITTPADALVTYTEDGCNVDKTICCNSVIDFNEFKPVVWLTNDMIEIDQNFDNYECAGQITDKTIYNSQGEKYFTDKLVKKFDYKVNEIVSEGWSIAKTCFDNDRIVFILKKNMFGGYSYLEYSKIDNKFVNQYIEKKSNNDGISDFFSNCEDVLDINKVKDFFIIKNSGL